MPWGSFLAARLTPLRSAPSSLFFIFYSLLLAPLLPPYLGLTFFVFFSACCGSPGSRPLRGGYCHGLCRVLVHFPAFPSCVDYCSLPYCVSAVPRCVSCVCYLSPCLSFVPRAVIVVSSSCVFSVVTCVPLLLAPCLSLLAEIKCSFSLPVCIWVLPACLHPQP